MFLFRGVRARPFFQGLLCALLLAGCHRMSSEQRQLRAELRKNLREGHYEKATELALRNLEFSPNEDGAWSHLVRAQIGAGDFEHAHQSLVDWRTRVAKVSAKYGELAGDLALAENQPARALEEWSRLLEQDPKNVRLLTKVAGLYRRRSAAGKRPRRPGAESSRWKRPARRLMERALARRQLHRWPEAVADAQRAQKIAPDEPTVYRGARLFNRLAKFLAEIRELDARLALAPEDDQTLADRALLFLRSEDAEMALSDSLLAQRMAPWAVRPKLFGALAALELGRPAEAEIFRVEPHLQIENLTPEILQTISRLDAELSVERGNAELLVSRAWQLNEIDQPRLALADAEEALKTAPEMTSALAERAFALAKLSRGEEALADLRRATELEPNLASAWQYRGDLEFAHGDFPAAAESLSHALTLSPNVAALEKREQAYRRLGLTEKADEDRRALDALKGP